MISSHNTKNTVSLKINSIQVLRGIAALMVVIVHTAKSLEKYHWSSVSASFLDKWGNFGVDIFFVISGFLMVVTTWNINPGISAAKKFAISRLERIIPLYWLLTTLLVSILILFPSIFNYQKFNSANVIFSFLFLPSLDSHGISNPILYVGWTLIYEMFFYAIFAFLLCFTQRYIVHFIFFIFLMLSLIGILESDNIFIKTYTNSLVFEFIFGCVIAILFMQSKSSSNTFAISALIGSLVLLPILNPYISILPRVVYFGIPAALLTFGCLWLDKNGKWPTLPLLQIIGNSSYSLYLSHIFVLPILGRLLLNPNILRSVSPDIIFILLLTICVTAGLLVHKYVENLLTQMTAKYFR